MFKYLKKNQLLINESTVYPGATREIFVKIKKKIFYWKKIFI